MDKYIELLQKAIKKQNELSLLNGWKDELLSLAPPVLWFGNNNTNKPKIITIGANPSRSEFLNGNNSTLRGISADNVPYLSKSQQRFYTFDKNELTSDLSLQKLHEIINSYNNYFTNHPYRSWFGKVNGGKVEALVNSFGASFYNDGNKQVLHLDLFPFATLSDFNKIKHLAEDDLFCNSWAQEFLLNLISNIEPEIIIVFGITNYNIFNRLFKNNLKQLANGKFINHTENNHTNYLISNFNNIKLVGLSINLGNPRGFNREDLLNLGKKIQDKF
jgi:hypothetical protein